MPDRPADVPAAMREAFAGHRTASAWNLVVSAEPNMRLAALLGFERLLLAQGLDLSDVATAIAALPAPEPEPRAVRVDLAEATTGTRTGFREAPVAHATDDRSGPEARPRPMRQVVKDAQVPETVVGRIRTSARPASATDRDPLVFTVETDHTVYGPIAAHAHPQRAMLIEAERSNWIVRMMIDRTHSDKVLPKVRRLETI